MTRPLTRSRPRYHCVRMTREALGVVDALKTVPIPRYDARFRYFFKMFTIYLPGYQ